MTEAVNVVHRLFIIKLTNFYMSCLAILIRPCWCGLLENVKFAGFTLWTCFHSRHPWDTPAGDRWKTETRVVSK